MDGIDLCANIPSKISIGTSAVIFQDFMRFEMTARENIAVGRIDQPHQQSDIEDAAHKSLADTVVSKLAGGYDQISLATALERGVELLRRGRWQKMALARAYLRDTQLLILDEPTAALSTHAASLRFSSVLPS